MKDIQTFVDPKKPVRQVSFKHEISILRWGRRPDVIMEDFLDQSRTRARTL